MTRHRRQWVGPALAAIALTNLAACAVADADNENPRLAQSRAIVQTLAGELKSELMAAVSEGGPVGAIGVCKDVAPAVASRLSREHGAKVSRTSLKVRNPSNLATDWQAAVLQQFDAAVADGEAVPPEFFEAQADGRFRYMKAIPTAGVCLACHGSELSPDVQQALDAQYPHDRARGYAPGDIRGAFSVEWPAAEGG